MIWGAHTNPRARPQSYCCIHIPGSSLEMLIPRVTPALCITFSASIVSGFLALVLIPNFCSKAVSWAIPSFGSSSKYFAAQVKAAAAYLSTRSASTRTVKPLDSESFVALSTLVRLVSIAASTPARSLETEVVVDACCGESCNNCRRVTIRTFSHAAVNNPGLIGVGGRDRSFSIVSCGSFHCEGANNGSGARSAPLALLSCSSNVF